MTTGLRQRKKTDTRRALSEAVLALSLERGYPNVTITEVVERVGVSRRTFSNYFPGKADCFVAVTDGWGDDFLDVLTDAPAEMPLEAILREALLRLADLMVTHFDAYFSVIHEEPELQAASGLTESARCARTAVVIADRLGLPPDDPRPDLVARFGAAAVQSCLESWWAAGRPSGRAGIATRLDTAFALLDLSALHPADLAADRRRSTPSPAP